MSDVATGTDRSVATARAQVYLLLAAAFDGDADRFAAAVEAGVFDRLADTVPGAPPTSALSGASPDPETLRVGYDNLFVVPGPHYVAPVASGYVESGEPVTSDSIYRDDQPGELLGHPAAVAANTYERFGFVPTRGTDFPDSLPALLEFAAALAAAEADVVDDRTDAELRQVQATFLAQQLGWVDAFADAVADADAVEGVYAALAAFTRAFVAFDREHLATPVE
jgi:TorA maturation chaperone TorD